MIQGNMANGRGKALEEGGMVHHFDRGALRVLKGDILADHRNAARGPLAGAERLHPQLGPGGAVKQVGLAQQGVPLQAPVIIMQQFEDRLARLVDYFGNRLLLHHPHPK